MILRVRSAILCDDIRHEDNGKALLIGVYANSLIARERPHIVQVQLAIALDVDAEVSRAELRISAQTTKTQQLSLRGSDGFAGVVAPLEIALTEERTLRAEIRNPDGEWMWAGEWQLLFAPDVKDAAPELAAHIHRIADDLKAAAESA